MGYPSDNAFDLDPATAWRCPGSGVGERVVLTYAQPIEVRAVGLIPGYAKTDPVDGTDRYQQNRRIVAVRWSFSDGSSVDQRVDPDPFRRGFQPVEVRAVTTSTITLEILATSAPGARDFTAISEIGVYGR